MGKEIEDVEKRIYISEAFNKKGEVLLYGWVHDTRDLGKIKFLILRDLSGRIQITAPEKEISKEVFEIIDKIPRESVIAVEGEIKENEQAPGGKEVFPKRIRIIAKAKHPLPIDVSEYGKTELSKRLDYRFLDLHREKIQAIFKIQSTISTSFREHFINKGFIEMQPPSIIGSASEGGTELFSCKYFEKDAYLAQSPQLYKQMVACSMEKAMTITPVWRAEKHNTTRHLNECRQMDIEMGFADTMRVMKQLEDVVKYIVKKVIEKNKKELEILNVELEVPEAKYFTFKEVAELMEKHKVPIEEDDLSSEAERKLDELFPNTIVFVYDWPLSAKPFYIMPKGEKADAELSEGFDAIYRGMEISSGGQRIHIPELLIERLKANGLNPDDFKLYIDSFRYGAPPHAGWSIGLERFTQVLLKLNNIREATMFPRDRDRISP